MSEDEEIEKELLNRLPVFPHTRDGKKLSPEKLEELISLLRKQIIEERKNSKK